MNDTRRQVAVEQDVLYQIKARGHLDPAWLVHFEGLSVTFEANETTIRGVFADQAALRGLLNWLWDLHLTVLAVVQQVPERRMEETKHEYGDPHL